ncbi:MAG TPA: glycosyltransferase family 1 protein [Pseudonocardiaceae bacterium]|nr:glycosyltransferase family 1 protein [Pseudonocardiaceae bacterium]
MPQLVVLAEQLLAPVPGGTGRYTRELLTALAAHAPEGWTVSSAVAKHSDPSPAVLPGVDGPRVLKLGPKILAAAWQRGFSFWPGGDAVHATTPLAPPGPKRGRSLVVTVHDTVPWTHPETLTKHGVAWHRAMISRAAERASAIVVPTNAVAAELTQHAPGTARVHVIGHGVPKALTEPFDEEGAGRIRRRLGLPAQFVLAIGTVEPRKGLDVLIEAMARPTAPELPLVVVGQPGWGGVNLSSLAANRGLPADRLLVLGKVTDAELAVVLRAASVLVVPSLAEGFGLPLLEGMAVGVPVVYSDAPALIEVAGGTGVMVRRNDSAQLANALRNVFADPARTEVRVAAAAARAAKFSWAGTARSVWNIHLELYQASRVSML